jgi:hypothetical protein
MQVKEFNRGSERAKSKHDMLKCSRDHMTMKVRNSSFTDVRMLEVCKFWKMYFAVNTSNAYMFIIKRILSEFSYRVRKILCYVHLTVYNSKRVNYRLYKTVGRVLRNGHVPQFCFI